MCIQLVDSIPPFGLPMFVLWRRLVGGYLVALAFDDASDDEEPTFLFIWATGIWLRLLLILVVGIVVLRSRFILFAFLVNILRLFDFPPTENVWTW